MSADQANQWRTAPGFMLAALGAAVGLGNIWRFSYVAGENGGGAFVLAYLVCVLAIGVPLLIAELAIGRASHTDPVTAFARVAPGWPWRWAGWPGVAACIAILGYYPVVAGWVANYLWHVAAHGVEPPGTVDHAARLAAMLADPVQALLWPAVVIAAGAVVVALGIAGGIERASAILMPLFFLLLVGLALHGLTLDGAARALGFGVLAPHLPGEGPFLDRLDHVASDILLPLSGIAIALVAGWRWRRLEALAEAGLTGISGWLWLWSLRALLPVAIALAMARGLGLL
jgi:NSS family neurotransmitter:Na+ symporter